MLKVEFYRTVGDEQILVGSFVWDGGEIQAIPASDEHAAVLEEILEGPVPVVDAVYTKDEPEPFMRNLYTRYKSAYFAATEAREDQGQKPAPQPPEAPTEPEQPTLFAEPLPDRPRKKVVEEEFDRDPKTGLITKRRITTIEVDE